MNQSERTPQGSDALVATNLGTFTSDAGAEIVAHDPTTQRLFITTGETIEVLDISTPTNPSLVNTIDITSLGGGTNSVAVNNGLVAIAIEADETGVAGTVAFYDTDGNFLNAVEAGFLPDALTFTPDGTKVLVANEGEPNDEYTVDPVGSISIIDLSNGVDNATVANASLAAFDGREAELRAKGVRIFGPGASASQDLEPEFIAVSPDGSQAFVTLQENNGVVVVDIATATVLDILPLGTKDWSKGQPEVTTFDFENRGNIDNGGDDLTTALGEMIELGGFSGFWYDGVAENGNLKFLTVPDRGPNGDAEGNDRPFLLPEYQARVVAFELSESTGEISITNETLLTRADGTTPITGLPNIPNLDLRAVDAEGNPVNDTAIAGLESFTVFNPDGTGEADNAIYDSFGADLEGITRANDGSFWMVDEYRPAIYNFDADGTLINRFVPSGTVEAANTINGEGTFAPEEFGQETLPEVYGQRRSNRGFEALALDEGNNTLYAFIQTPMDNPDSDIRDSDVIRILAIDTATGNPISEYVYALEGNADPGIRNSLVDKIGDAVFDPDTGNLFVVERDSSLDSTGKQLIFEINLTGATDILGTDLSEASSDTTLESLSIDDLAAEGIQVVSKLKVTNLPSLGYQPSDKTEGLSLLPAGRLAVLNDNDFGLVEGAEAVQLGLIDFPVGNQLDASNEDGDINLRNWPIYGLFQPDAISSFVVDGETYYITANEGDARDYDGFTEEFRIGDEEIVLDPTAFPDAEMLKADENLGRLRITDQLGDLDGDGDFDQLFSYGGRSFSIWDEQANLVFDSGDDIALITANLTPELFNADAGDPAEFDERSDDKGAEPESVTTGIINDTPYAFISLERSGGGILIYDVSNPTNPDFVQYIRTDGDIAPEGLAFISETDSPNGLPLLALANEESLTTTLYELSIPQDTSEVEPSIFGTSEGNTFDTEVPGDGGFIGDSQLLFAGAGDDFVDVTFAPGDNRIDLGSGDDIVLAGTNNRILGGSGQDLLFLNSGGGNNVVTGGTESDQFWLVTDEEDLPAEANIITDFVSGEDVIGFGTTSLSFEDLTLTLDGNNTTINGLGQTLAIVTEVTNLSESDFVFA
ncbi:MAG: esterase-like activity of phytase family protein [Cyanobacteria bacterium P01_G01_bin.49]